MDEEEQMTGFLVLCIFIGIFCGLLGLAGWAAEQFDDKQNLKKEN